MDNGLAESRLRSGFLIDMNRIVISAQVGKRLYVFRRDGAVDDIGLTYFERVVSIRIALHAWAGLGLLGREPGFCTRLNCPI